MNKKYTLSIYTENTIGLTNRLMIIFTRRKINIESLTTSASELEGVHRFTIVVDANEEQIHKVAKQIEKVIDVIKCYCFEDDDIIFQEIALYKVAIKDLHIGKDVERIVRQNHARILTVKPEFIVIEKTGHENETHELYQRLKPYGLMQFARSGRIALSESRQEVSKLLQYQDRDQANLTVATSPNGKAN